MNEVFTDEFLCKDYLQQLFANIQTMVIKYAKLKRALGLRKGLSVFRHVGPNVGEGSVLLTSLSLDQLLLY